MKLLLGDCLDKLKELDDNSVDSIVTDPPYGLGFMGKDWDTFDKSQFGKQGEEGENDLKNKKNFKILPRYNTDGLYQFTKDWATECYRVLKPGGHILSFAGSRTYHKICMGIEDAGFEIRDQIMWVYGSGFPKSMDISKQIDKREGAERKVIGTKGLNSYKTKEDGQSRHKGLREDFDKVNQLTAPATDEAKQWEGWGTALKPAHEPIVMARKPLSEKTVVDNVLEWGTGGINIDESRIPFKDEADKKESTQKNQHADFGTKPLTGNVIYGDYSMVEPKNYNPPGRFPANIIFDEEAGKILDEQSGISKSTGGRSGNKEGIWDGRYNGEVRDENPGLGDIGGASRFFYCPKTSKTDRNEGVEHLEDKYYAAGNQAKAELKRGNTDFNANKGKGRDERHNHNQVGVSKNHHPTVKPTSLMLYLIRLVTLKGGTTLDPFMGSGSTGKGAVRGGFDFIGIEREEEYFRIAEARIQYEIDNPYNEERGERIETNKNANKFF